MVDAETRALLETYAAYRTGSLPAPVDWNDQSRGWVRAIRVVESEIGVIEAKREAIRKAREGKGSGG